MSVKVAACSVITPFFSTRLLEGALIHERKGGRLFGDHAVLQYPVNHDMYSRRFSRPLLRHSARLVEYSDETISPARR